jgi:hypothetical protein
MRMCQEFLNSADVIAIFEQMRREGMAEGMGGDVFHDPRRPDCLP